MAPIGGEKKNFAVNGKNSVLGRDLHSKRAKFKSHLYKHNNFKNLFLGVIPLLNRQGRDWRGGRKGRSEVGTEERAPLFAPAPSHVNLVPG